MMLRADADPSPRAALALVTLVLALALAPAAHALPPFALTGTWGPQLVRDGAAHDLRLRAPLDALDLTAATPGPRWSAFAELRAAPDSGVARLGAAWLQLGGAGGTARLRFGRLPQDVPWLAVGQRTTRAPFLTPLGREADGVEAAGEDEAWRGALGYVRSERPWPHEAGRAAWRTQDSYVRVDHERGDERWSARMLFARQESDLPEHAWLQHLQARASAQRTLGRATWTGAFVLDRFDDRPAAGLHERHEYGLLEALVPLDPARRWWLDARAERAHRAGNAVRPGADGDVEVLDLAWQWRPALRLALEGAHAGGPLAAPARETLDAFVRVAL